MARLDTTVSRANALARRNCHMTVRKPLSVQRVREVERDRRRRAERRRALGDFLIGVIGVLLVISIAVYAAHQTGFLHRAKSELRQLQVFGSTTPLDAARFSRSC
jgi:hypothetical protein